MNIMLAIDTKYNYNIILCECILTLKREVMLSKNKERISLLNHSIPIKKVDKDQLLI